MASRSRHSSRSDRDSDSMEALKPLVVLVLFGTILYGAYSVVQKGPSSPAEPTPPAAPPFAPPAVEVATSAAAPAAPAAPLASATPLPTATSGPLPVASNVTPPVPPPVTPPIQVPAAPPVSAPVAFAGAANPGLVTPATVPPPPPAMPTAPPAAEMVPAATAAAAGAALGTAAALDAARPPATAPTYLTAESAPPPAQDAVPPPAAAGLERPDRYATLSTTPPASAGLLPGNPAPPPATSGSSAAFATAWADAHEKLAAGRYAEALAALSIWYDDPSLGLEESQRLEDLLGQLAGSVIYSQQDLLLPPHVVAAGETLPAIAMPLGISWQLLGKINGIASPQNLVPGEHLKVLRGPFDGVVSVSRRRLSLQLGGNYAGSFPVVVGRQLLTRVGGSITVTEVRRGAGRDIQPMATLPPDAAGRPSIVLADGFVIEAADDPGMASDTSAPNSLVVSIRDLAELMDILGPGSKVLIRQ